MIVVNNQRSFVAIALCLAFFIAPRCVESQEVLGAAAEWSGDGKIQPKSLQPTSGGAFRFRIPIETPSYHNISPELALVYSSSVGRTSFLGPGWILTGLPTIVRRGLRRGTPNYVDSADATDMFLLGGAELVPCASQTAVVASPSCSTGSMSARSFGYSTLIETYLRIRHEITPVDRWIVTTRDGTRKTFSAIDINSDGSVWRWGLTRIEDTVGNTVTVAWEPKMADVCDSAKFDDCSEAYPSTIVYGEEDSIPFYVNFEYNEASGSKPQFGNGHHIVTVNARLSGIQIRTRDSGTRGYWLSYGRSHPEEGEDTVSTDSGYTPHYRLEQVQEWGHELPFYQANMADATFLPPTKLHYSYVPGNWYYGHTEIWDGLSPQPNTRRNGLHRTVSVSDAYGSFRTRNSLVDMDGDGYLDSVDEGSIADEWIVRRNLGHVAKEFSGSGTNWEKAIGFSSPRRSLFVDPLGTGVKFLEYGELVDMNADGRPDFVFAKLDLYPGIGDPDDWVWHVNMNLGDLFWDEVEVPTMSGLQAPMSGELWAYQDTVWSSVVQLIDMNGDGLLDYVKSTRRDQTPGAAQYTLWDFEVALNLGGLSSAAPMQMGPLEPWTGNIENKPLVRKRTFEDGPPNVVVGDASVGGGGASLSFSFATAHSDYTRSSLIDMNGDGLPDHVYVKWDNTNDRVVQEWQVRLNTGSSFSPTTRIWEAPWPFSYHPDLRKLAPSISESWTSANRNEYVVKADMRDMNNDGLVDSVVAVPTVTGKYDIYVGFNNGVDKFLYQRWAEERNFPLGVGDDSGVTVQGLYDFNADGLIDNVYTTWERPNSLQLKIDTTVHVAMATRGVDRMWIDGSLEQVNQPSKPDLLVKISSPSGGTTRIKYQPSTWHPDTRMPLSQTVTAVTVRDGRGRSATTEYAYSGGRYNYAKQRSMGFKTITSREPAPWSDISFPIAGIEPETVTTYLQNCDRGGLLQSVTRYGGPVSSSPIGTTVTEYVYEDSSGNPISEAFWPAFSRVSCASFLADAVPTIEPLPLTVLTTETRDIEYSPLDPSDFRTHLRTATYDEYGNISTATDWGDVNVVGDETTTVTSYASNENSYILSTPRTITKHAGLANTGKILERTRLCYDYDIGLRIPFFGRFLEIACSDPPVDGLVTKQLRCTIFQSCSEYEATSASYDTWGNIIAATDARNFTTTFMYDSDYHIYLTSATNTLRHTVSTPLSNWNLSCNEPLKRTDANNNDTWFTYDPVCRITSVTPPGARARTTSYEFTGDPKRQRIRTETPHPHGVTRWSETFLDGFGNAYLTTSTGPGSTGSGMEVIRRGVRYTSRGNIRYTEHPCYRDLSNLIDCNNRTTFAYDGFNRVVYESPPYAALNTTRFGLGEITMTDSRGHVRREFIDIFGRTVERQSIDGSRIVSRTTYTYDLLGNLRHVVDDAENVWTYGYDALGRRNYVDDPDAGITNVDYFPGGLIKQTTDNKGQQVSFLYDPLGRPTVKMVNDDQGSTIEKYAWRYDEVRRGAPNIGFQTSSFDLQLDDFACAHSERTVGVALDKSCSSCAAKVCECYKDNSGNCRPPPHNDLPLGTARTYCCDASDPRGWDEFCCELADRLCPGKVLSVRTMTDYNNQAQIEKHTERVSNTSYTTSFGYYDTGDLNHIVYPEPDLSLGSATRGLRYDLVGRLYSIPAVVRSIDYEADGRPTRQVNVNETVIEWTYGDAAPSNTMLVELKTSSGPNVLQSLTYRYDSEGSMTSVVGLNDKENWTYDYDVDHRLTLAEDDGPAPKDGQFYVYDTIGNIISDGTYPPSGSPRPHAVISRQGHEYKYDENGNMTLAHELDVPFLAGPVVHQFAWNAQNQLVHSQNSKKHSFYNYDATSGARTRKGVFVPGRSPETTLYLSGGFELQGPADTWNTSQWRATAQVRIGNRLIAMRESDRAGRVKTTWNSPNHQGSIHLQTDDTGTVKARQTYFAYGNELTTQDNTGSAVPPLEIGFLGERIENSFITYMNARYYSPELGRFLSPDPLDLTTPAALNRYAYAYNNPIMLEDPSGLSPEENELSDLLDERIQNQLDEMINRQLLADKDYAALRDRYLSRTVQGRHTMALDETLGTAVSIASALPAIAVLPGGPAFIRWYIQMAMTTGGKTAIGLNAVFNAAGQVYHEGEITNPGTIIFDAAMGPVSMGVANTILTKFPILLKLADGSKRLGSLGGIGKGQILFFAYGTVYGQTKATLFDASHWENFLYGVAGQPGQLFIAFGKEAMLSSYSNFFPGGRTGWQYFVMGKAASLGLHAFANVFADPNSRSP